MNKTLINSTSSERLLGEEVLVVEFNTTPDTVTISVTEESRPGPTSDESSNKRVLDVEEQELQLQFREILKDRAVAAKTPVQRQAQSRTHWAVVKSESSELLGFESSKQQRQVTSRVLTRYFTPLTDYHFSVLTFSLDLSYSPDEFVCRLNENPSFLDEFAQRYCELLWGGRRTAYNMPVNLHCEVSISGFRIGFQPLSAPTTRSISCDRTSTTGARNLGNYIMLPIKVGLKDMSHLSESESQSSILTTADEIKQKIDNFYHVCNNALKYLFQALVSFYQNDIAGSFKSDYSSTTTTSSLRNRLLSLRNDLTIRNLQSDSNVGAVVGQERRPPGPESNAVYSESLSTSSSASQSGTNFASSTGSSGSDSDAVIFIIIIILVPVLFCCCIFICLFKKEQAEVDDDGMNNNHNDPSGPGYIDPTTNLFVPGNAPLTLTPSQNINNLFVQQELQPVYSGYDPETHLFVHPHVEKRLTARHSKQIIEMAERELSLRRSQLQQLEEEEEQGVYEETYGVDLVPGYVTEPGFNGGDPAAYNDTN